MIIEIALGIVLAVLILAFLPYMIAAGLIAAIAAAVLLWAFSSPETFFTVVTIALVIFAVVYFAIDLPPKLEPFAKNLPPTLKRWFPWRSERERRKDLGYDDSPTSADDAGR